MIAVPVADLLDMLTSARPAVLRRPGPGEEPDFVQKRSKMATGISGRTRHGVAFSIEFNPPFQLVAGRGYVVEIID